MLLLEQAAPPLVAKVTGYLLSYGIFTTILYFIIQLAHEPWAVWHVIALTAGIAIVGRTLSRWLG
jgi:hypothetical protein